MKLKLHLLLLLILSSFLSVAQITTVGLIGSATPNGWDSDTDMIQDASNPDIWTLSIILKKGEVKFRANDDWAINWGSNTFPKGTGTQNGPNIKVYDGEYLVTFNSSTGEYYFDVNSDIGLVGDATPGGWNEDTEMYINPDKPDYYIVELELKDGGAKFRKDKSWTVNWGSNTFPKGTGTQDGPNIPVKAGKYVVHFNPTTGEYDFESPLSFKSIGVIGSATSGGWDKDTDLNQDANNSDYWTGFVDLVVGELKFRANDSWDINWGGTDFPSGTASQNGSNISIPKEGRYLIGFNTKTLEYSFTEIKPFTTIGLVGTAQGSWDTDTDMIKDTINPALWSVETTLVDGEAKFRAEDAWTVNWGAKDFPGGIGVQNGPNIPVIAGKYTVTLNTVTGEYYFQIHSDIGIIGSATPNGWSKDIDLFQDRVDTNKYFTTLTLKSGEVKFRQNDDWAVNWGASEFPSGIGVQDGPNIPIAQGGKYFITFNKATGAYNFVELLDYQSIGVIGTATAGGWDSDTDLNRDPNDGNLWKARIPLKVGELKFRANDEWVYDWGGTELEGTAISKGPNIAIPEEGTYQINFNSRTLAYSIKIIKPYQSVGIIGSATPGGWDSDTDMNRDADDPTIWRLRIKLVNGEAKFRANDSWDVNWGAGTFPSGIGEQDGANIPIKAGEYKITFNTLTGEYNFEEVKEFGKISLVGRSGPAGDWPGSDDSRDTYLKKDDKDPNHWTLESVTLTDAPDPAGGDGVKFRAEAAWTINWGAPDFPKGIGKQNGPNIKCVAGTYKVDFRSDTGEYAFGEPSSTYDLLSNSSIAIYPNPTAYFINIEIKEESLKGNTNVTILDNTGRKVYSSNFIGKTTIDVNKLINGSYLIQLSGTNFMVGRKISIIR